VLLTPDSLLSDSDFPDSAYVLVGTEAKFVPFDELTTQTFFNKGVELIEFVEQNIEAFEKDMKI
jgi:hypothetical protein